jgi:hypothetical protein
MVALALVLGAWWLPAAAQTPAASPLGAYPGETVAVAPDPTGAVSPTPCQVQATGPTLLFSDDPERVPGPGILYRATVSGAVRILLFHVNASAQPLHMGVLMSNPGRAPVQVLALQVGTAGPGRDPLEVGKQAEHLWFLPHPLYTYTLLGHQSWFLDGPLVDIAVPPGETLAAVYQLQTTAPVTFTLVAQTAPSLSLAGLRVLPNSSVAGTLGTPMRGTFPSADLTCSVKAAVPSTDMLAVRLGAPGSFLHGTSTVDGGVATVDAGNYGVVYHLHLVLTEGLATPDDFYALLLEAQGGPFAGIASIAANGQTDPAVVPLPVNQPQLDGPGEAAMLGTVRLYPLIPTTLDLSWMPAAGSTLPVQLLVYGLM